MTMGATGAAVPEEGRRHSGVRSANPQPGRTVEAEVSAWVRHAGAANGFGAAEAVPGGAVHPAATGTNI